MLPNGMLCAILAGLALSSLSVRIVQKENEALESLAQAERLFSKRCGEVGFRQSFLENFAEDGVFFMPMPRNCKENLLKEAEEPKPKFPPFEWAPITADVSTAGDLGYTTGPLRFWSEDGSKPVRWGYYFSVWRREAGGWKVVVDLGLDASGRDFGDPAKAVFRPAPDFRVGRSAYPIADAVAENSLRRAEEEFGRKAAAVSMAEAIASAGTPSVRVHRGGFDPATDHAAIEAMLKGVGRSPVWRTIEAGVAKSGDFGYTYGRFESELDGGTKRKGYWARVWKRDDGKWRLVVDVANQEKTASEPLALS